MKAKSYAEQLEFLIARRFPDAWNLEGKETTDPRVSALRQYKRELRGMSQETFEEEYIRVPEEHARKQEELERRNDQLRFFSQPDAAADFQYWCALKSWTLEEATALLLGKDPRTVSSRSLYGLASTSPFARSYQKLRSQLLRAKADGAVKDGESPCHLVDWVVGAGIAIPPELDSALNPTEADSGPEIEGRERASLLKLVLGMAIKQYGYDPTEGKSSVPKEISDDLDRLDLSVSLVA